MAWDHGFPFFYNRQGFAARTPADTGFSATPYAGGAGVSGNVVSIEGFGLWSAYFIATANPGNNEIYITIRDENDAADLAELTLSLAIAGLATYQHLTFGLPGTTLPLVARKIRFRVRNAAAVGGAFTLRLMGIAG